VLSFNGKKRQFKGGRAEAVYDVHRKVTGAARD